MNEGSEIEGHSGTQVVTRRAAMKTALKAGAYTAPVVLSTVVPSAVAAVSPPMADLALTKTASTITPPQGSQVTFMVTLTNNGPSQATGVTVLDALPAGLTFVSATPGGGTTYSSASGLWNIGALANGARATLTLAATVSGAVGTGITNVARVSHSDQGDPNGGNNSASVTVTPGVRTAVTFIPAPGSPIPVGHEIQDIAVGDFNGDGKPDLAVTNEGDNTVSVLLGNGNGSFTNAPGSPTAAGLFPYGIAAGDFNGDGKPDLVVTNISNRTVSVLLGNGSGGFTNASSSPTYGNLPSDIAAGDFNGDRKLDLAIINDSIVSVLLGNGSGGFTIAPSLFVGRVPFGIAVGDFNKDGNLDLAVTSELNTTVYVLLGNGTGSFTNAPGSPFFVGILPAGIAVGDFNGDGNLDLAVTTEDDDMVNVLLGDGSGGFTRMPGFSVHVGNTPRGIVVGDFNGDGIPDLAIGNYYGNNVSVLLGNGNGSFTPASGSPVAVGRAPRRLVVGDFNGDGKLDFAVANTGDDTVSVLLQQ